MKKKNADKLSKAFGIIRDCYYAKANELEYSKIKLAFAIQCVRDMFSYIDKRSDDVEKEFLCSCIAAFEVLKEDEEEDFTKISRFAEAVHRVPYLFCGEEKWNKAFKEKYIIPFCQMYGYEWFEDVLSISIPANVGLQKTKKNGSRFSDFNSIMSLGKYFCFRMLIPLIVLPIILGLMLYVHYSDYTETDHGERYEITVTDFEYEHTEHYDYLYIYCAEYEERFEISRFFQYSNSPEELIKRCENGDTLVVYADYKIPKNSDDYYDVIQIESLDGTVYRSYEHSNQMDRHMLTIMMIIALFVFVPYFILFLLMLMVASNPNKFASYPKFVRFCFPNYSLYGDKG